MTMPAFFFMFMKHKCQWCSLPMRWLDDELGLGDGLWWCDRCDTVEENPAASTPGPESTMSSGITGPMFSDGPVPGDGPGAPSTTTPTQAPQYP